MKNALWPIILGCVALTTVRVLPLLADDLDGDSEVIEKLRRTISGKFNDDELSQRLASARARLQEYEETFGVDDWRYRSQRLAIQEYERVGRLDAKQLGVLVELKARMEKEAADGVSYKCAEMLTDVRKQFKQLVGEGPTYRRMSEFALVSCYLANSMESAVEIGRESVAAAKAIGEDSPDYASSATNLAFLLTCKGDFGEANKLLRKATALNLNLFGRDGEPYLESLNRLAYLKLRQGEAIEAYVIGSEAALGYMRLTKSNDCEVSSVAFTCGMANAALQRKNVARKALEKFMELADGFMAPDHPLLLEATEELKRLRAD